VHLPVSRICLVFWWQLNDEVVQNDVVASITRPVRQLKGFQWLHVGQGETVTVEFALPADELALL
jgi:beta-glucosidase